MCDSGVSPSKSVTGQEKEDDISLQLKEANAEIASTVYGSVECFWWILIVNFFYSFYSFL